MTRPSTDHVIIHDEVDGSFELRCNHCADFHHPRLPIRADHLADRLLGFVRMHRLCPKPEAPSSQLTLPGTSEPQPCGCVGTKHYYPCAIDNAGIDASTDEPAPEIDPPGPYALFDRMYPPPPDDFALLIYLRTVLSDEQMAKLPSECPWDVRSGIFHAVANWCRIEAAHKEAGSREPIAGLTIPRREPMPVKLAELLGEKPKEKRGARPLTSPKRKRRSIMEQKSD